MSLGRILLLTVLAAAPGAASAQFTTFIPPQNKVADSVKAAVAVQQKAQTDSVAAAQITNMKTWVDSAAGTTPAPTTAADSLAQNIAVNDTLNATTTFANGTRAPETASSLPLILLLGAVTLAAGGMMVVTGSEPRPARARGSRRRA